MQVHVKPTFFQSFGGINFMESDFKKLGFEDLIAFYLMGKWLGVNGEAIYGTRPLENVWRRPCSNKS